MQRNAFACVSNARPSVDLSTAKIISGTNIPVIIPQKSCWNGYPIMVFENKKSSFKIVKQ